MVATVSPIIRKTEIDVAAATIASIFGSGLIKRTPENVAAVCRSVGVDVGAVRLAWDERAVGRLQAPRPRSVDSSRPVVPNQGPASPTTAALQSEVDRLRLECEQLRARTSAVAVRQRSATKPLEDKIAELTAERDQLRRSLARAEHAKDQADRRVAALEAEIERLRSALTSAQAAERSAEEARAAIEQARAAELAARLQEVALQADLRVAVERVTAEVTGHESGVGGGRAAEGEPAPMENGTGDSRADVMRPPPAPPVIDDPLVRLGRPRDTPGQALNLARWLARNPEPGKTRICSGCGEIPVFDENGELNFHIKNRATGNLDAFCKKCRRVYGSSRYARIGTRIVAIEVVDGDGCVGHPCPRCGQPFTIGQLVVGDDLHHEVCPS